MSYLRKYFMAVGLIALLWTSMLPSFSFAESDLEGVNIALNKEAKASSEVEMPTSHPAQYATDGEAATFWQPTSTDRNTNKHVWISVDLDGEKTFNELYFSFADGTESAITQIELLYSNDEETWHPFLERTGNGGFGPAFKHRGDEVNARFVKAIFHIRTRADGSTPSFKLAEFQVFKMKPYVCGGGAYPNPSTFIPKIDLALNKSGTASSQVEVPEPHLVEYAFDGSRDTWWKPASRDRNDHKLVWIQIDLEQELTLNEVYFEFAEQSEIAIKQIELLYSDNAIDWETLYVTDEVSFDSTFSYSFDAIEARYVQARFHMNERPNGQTYDFKLAHFQVLQSATSYAYKTGRNIEDVRGKFGEEQIVKDAVLTKLGQAAAFGHSADGTPELYFYSNGVPGTFQVLDGITGESIFSETIPGMNIVWGMTVAPNGDVYFGNTDNGKLYRYVSADQHIEDLGVNPSGRFIWALDMTDDGNFVYGAVYPNGAVFEYDVQNNTFRNLGTMMVGMDYARGIGVTDEYIFAGMGTSIGSADRIVVRYDRATGEKVQIPVSTSSTMIYDTFYYGGHLLVKAGANLIKVLDENTFAEIGEIWYDREISPPAPFDEQLIYYKYGTAMYTYHLQSHVIQQVGQLPDHFEPFEMKRFAWIEPNSGEYEGKTILAGITDQGEYFWFDPISLDVIEIEPEIAGTGVKIQSMTTGPDGKLYIGGYQKGTSIFDPARDKFDVQEFDTKQPEGTGFLNGKVYFGIYSGAYILEYDTARPWKVEAGSDNNYRVAHRITGQDRPFVFASGENKLFVGTIPDYGSLGGTLAIYDETLNTWTEFDHAEVVPNQSITGLVYHEGKVYGSTSIYGGLGSNPTEFESRVFIWDVATEQVILGKKLDFLPCPQHIGNLTFGPDGLLWGISGGVIFAMHPQTLTVVKAKEIVDFDIEESASYWRPFNLHWGEDDYIYTSVGRKLTVIDPLTLESLKLADHALMMTLGADGSLYFTPGDQNMHVLPVGTKLAEVYFDTHQETMRVEQTQSVRIIAKNHDSTTIDVTDETTFESSNDQVATISAEGFIQAKAVGKTVITASYKGKMDKFHLEVIAKQSGNPSPPPYDVGGYNPGKNGGQETEKNIVYVKEQLFNEHQNGTLVIQLDQVVDEVRIPYDAGTMLQSGSLTLKTKDMMIELPGSWFESLRTTPSEESFAYVSLQLYPVSSNDLSDGIKEMENNQFAQLTFAEVAYDVNFSLLYEDGRQVQVNLPEGAPDSAFKVSFMVPSNVDETLLGVYSVDEGNLLRYEGGRQHDEWIEVQLNDAGRYALLAFDKQFLDLPGDHWATQAIKAMAAKRIIRGVSETEYSPSAFVTRAEFTALLVRALQLKVESTVTSTFEDVTAEDWFAKEVTAAAEAGLVQGVSAHNFAPNASISREEMATMIVRAYNMMVGDELPGIPVNEDHFRFSDEDEISDWALSYVTMARINGLLQGKSNDRFDPVGTTTRAEAAQAIYNMLGIKD